MDLTIALNNGIRMPRLGLGLYKATGGTEAEDAVRAAAEIGYRLFDTASAYKNEEEVGRGLRATGIPREELFVTTKVWNTAQRIGNIEGAFSRSLERLGLDYVDLYLIHWPVPGCYLDTWHVLEEIYQSGRARAIGVSNFTPFQLDDILMHGTVVPAVNQIELHPLNSQDETRTFCQKNGIVVQAYAPLARGAYLDLKLMRQLAEKHHRSPAQIGLRWILQKGVTVIPKSVHPDRLLENSQIFDFSLDENEVAAIDALNEDRRVAGIPEDMRDTFK